MLSDELLMAYADGQLDAADRARVAKLVAQDPALAANLAVFEATGNSLAPAFDEFMASPLSPGLERIVLKAQPFAPRSTSKLAALGDALRNILRPSPLSFGLAAASAAVLAVGIGALPFLSASGAGTSPFLQYAMAKQDRVAARSAFQDAMEHMPGTKAASATLPDAGVMKIKVALSFRDHDGDYCRQYEATLGTSGRYGGIACKQGGEWKVRFEKGLAATHSSPYQIRPAEGPDPELTAELISMIDNEAFDAQAEEQLIHGGWKKP